MAVELFHLWRHTDSFLTAAFNGTNFLSSAMYTTGIPLWTGEEESSATTFSREAIAEWLAPISGQIMPLLTIYEPGNLCSVVPDFNLTLWYATLYDLCKVDTCQWVTKESNLDVFLWVFAVMGTVLSVVLIVGALLYDVANKLQQKIREKIQNKRFPEHQSEFSEDKAANELEQRTVELG